MIIITNMLNYQLMKHTNQMISYYTEEVILYNYTFIYTWNKQYKHNLSTACKKTCYNFCVRCLQLVSFYAC